MTRGATRGRLPAWCKGVSVSGAQDEFGVAVIRRGLSRDMARLPAPRRRGWLLQLASWLMQEAACLRHAAADPEAVAPLVSISAGLGKLADEAGRAACRPVPPPGS